MFVKHLMCVRCCSKYWGYKLNLFEAIYKRNDTLRVPLTNNYFYLTLSEFSSEAYPAKWLSSFMRVRGSRTFIHEPSHKIPPTTISYLISMLTITISASTKVSSTPRHEFLKKCPSCLFPVIFIYVQTARNKPAGR